MAATDCHASKVHLACAVLLSIGGATLLAATSTHALRSSPFQAVATAERVDAPVFDVVSVKRNPEPGTNYPLSPPIGGRLVLRNQTVRGLISSSYGVQDYQIIGGPSWLRSDGFDIDARVEAAVPPSPQQMLLRVRTLLADRFKLVMRKEQRELSVYRLVLARRDGRLGPKIRRRPCVARPQADVPVRDEQQISCGTSVGVGTMVVGGGTMRLLAQQLGRYAGIERPVIDATNLADQVSWELKWTPDLGDGTAPVDGVSIFTALQEQLGVRLEPARSRVDVLVVDSVEQPSEN